MPQTRLIYISRLARPLDNAELQRLVGSAQIHNRRRDITGLLAFTGRHFVQVLEGDDAALDRLLTSLMADPRHTAVKVLWRQSIATRQYDRWAMHLVSGLDLADEVQTLAEAEPVDAAAALALTARLFHRPELGMVPHSPLADQDLDQRGH